VVAKTSRHVMHATLDRLSPGWKEPYHALLGIGPKPLTKEARKKIEDMLKRMHNLPDYPD
jgi:hypothetical protein